MMDELALYIFLLKTAILADKPDMTLVMAAKYMLTQYARFELPDWVESLANASLENWPAAVDEIRTGMKEEEE
jgi:hypothetical protein